MFLIRTAFWLTLIILLLPTNEEQQRQIYGTAEAAVNDVRSFCTRNPDVCAKSRAAFDTFTEKAKFGANMLVDVIAGQEADETRQAGAAEEGQRVPASLDAAPDSRNTLTAEDMQPAWNGPSAGSGV